MPFDYYILKVTGRCNLNCSYCYMYNLADQTWRIQPKFMSNDVVEATAQKILDHCVKHKLSQVVISLHGGEPLLLGINRMQFLIEVFESKFKQENIALYFGLQTNATLINNEWMDFFARYNIPIGVSMDGPEKIHDKFRLDHGGNGSYEKIVSNIAAARRHKLANNLIKGVLCVINIESDPLEVIDHFIGLGFDDIDFLLPEGNYGEVPFGKTSFEHTPYADWLIKAFDKWFNLNNPSIHINMFIIIIELLLGRDIVFDSLGGASLNLVTIETNGEMEPLDALKSVSHGITKTGLNVLHNDIDELSDNQFIRILNMGREGTSKICKECCYFNVCGGGYLPHRYDRDSLFDNPSVYCKDLYKLINHIEGRLSLLRHMAKVAVATTT